MDTAMLSSFWHLRLCACCQDIVNAAATADCPDIDPWIPDVHSVGLLTSRVEMPQNIHCCTLPAA